MRTARSLAFALLSFGLALGACGDDDGGGTADAGERVDSGPGADSGPAEASCGIQVIDSLGVLADSTVGLIVSFNRPDGSLIGTAFTDVDGVAMRDDCVADTMISTGGELSLPPGTGPTPTALFTVAGVQPGDTVVVGAPSGPPVASSLGEFTSPSNATADLAYTLYTNCTSFPHTPGTTTDWPIGGSCSPSFDTIGVVRNLTIPEPHNIVGYSSAFDTTYVPGGVTEVTLGDWATLTESPKHTLNVSNPPGFATDLFTYLVQSRNFRFLLSFDSFYIGDLSSAVQRFFPMLPSSLFDNNEVWLDLSFNPPAPAVFGGVMPAGRSYSKAGIGGPPGDQTTVDLAATLLPRLAGVIVTSPDAAARPVVTWFTDTATDADGAVFRVGWGNGWPETTNRPRGVWLFVTPNVAEGSLTAPTLPEGLQPFAPREDESPAQVSKGAIFDFDWLDYGDIITSQLDLTALENAEPSAPPTIGNAYLRRVSTWMGPVISGCSASAGQVGSFATIGFALLLLGLRRRRE